MKKIQRLIAFVVSTSIVLGTTPYSVFAQEACGHHVSHTSECGYQEVIAGTPCLHEHSVDCYVEMADCIHEHHIDCYADGILPLDHEAKEASACTHECSEEGGCIRKELDCQHEHDEECEYKASVEDSYYTYTYEIFFLQELIDSLPEDITDENIEEVKKHLSQIEETKANLTYEQINRLDISKYEHAVYAIQHFDEEMSAEVNYGIWDGSIATKFAGGDGTESNPYQIENGAQLALLVQETLQKERATKGKYYILTEDIYLNDISDFGEWEDNPPANKWTPIGTCSPRGVIIYNYYKNQFFGNFNGDGHTVYGVYINSDEECTGLFGSIEGAVITNLEVKDAYISGGMRVGGITGHSNWESKVEYCNFNGIVKGKTYTGGIAGSDNCGTYSYCSSTGTISGGTSVGGIVGIMNQGQAYIKYCYNTGNVSGTFDVGGIVGSIPNNDNSRTDVIDCYNAGDVNGTDGYIGGIAGSLGAKRCMTRCYNAGKVTCENEDGRCGGIIGNREVRSGLYDSYFLNTTAKTDIGDGNWYDPNPSNSKTHEEMKLVDTFVNYDFIDIWYMDPNDSYEYPQLIKPSSRHYGKIFVVDKKTNEPLSDYSVEFDNPDKLFFVSVENDIEQSYIVGTKSNFLSSMSIRVSKSGYWDFEFLSNDLRTSASINYAPDNIIYLVPKDEEIIDDEKQKLYILEHINFAKNKHENFVNRNGFDNAYWQFDNGDSLALANIASWLGNVNEVTQFKFDDIKYEATYYDLFLSDLITTMADVEHNKAIETAAFDTYQKYYKKVKKNWIQKFREIDENKEDLLDPLERDAWNSIIPDIGYSMNGHANWSIVERDIDQLLSGDEKDFELNKGTEKLIDFITKPEFIKKHEYIIDGVFEGFSVASNISEYISDAGDSINTFQQTTQAYIISAAYSEINEYFFTVVESAIDEMDDEFSKKLSKTLNKYEGIANNKFLLYFNCLAELANNTGGFIYQSFIRDYFKKATLTSIADFLGCPVANIQAIILAYNLGYAIGDKVTGLNDKSEQYIFMYYIAPFEAALEKATESYGNMLLNEQTYENAKIYDYAYRTLAATNKYLYNCMYTLSASGTEIHIGDIYIGQVPECMEFSSKLLNEWTRIKCHGNANSITNRYKYTTIQCPVDVYIYDSDGKTLVSIINEKVTEYDPSIIVLNWNQKKTLIYPADKDYKIKVVAREKGIMNYYVAELGENTRNIEFYNIPLSKNIQYDGFIPAEFNIDSSEYRLYSDNTEVDESYDSNNASRCLDAPSELTWNGKKASWNYVSDANYYIVYLIKNGEFVESVVAEKNEYDFGRIISENGKYRFCVVSMGDGVIRLNSRMSPYSTELDISSSNATTGNNSKHIFSNKNSIIIIPDMEGGTISAKPSAALKGDIVTITATPDIGYTLKTLTVTDNRGNEIELVEKSDGKYTFIMPSSKVTVDGSFEKIMTDDKQAAELFNPFIDINKSDWFYNAVLKIYANKIMNGISENEFAPQNPTTRGMIVTILYNTENRPAPQRIAPFLDVTSDKYYADAVAWASENNIVSGYDTQTFGPNDPITREQLASILWRYAKYKGYDVSVDQDTNILSYTDTFNISEYAIPAMQWTCGAGIMSGNDDGTLNPSGFAKRAEVASILVRFYNNI